MELNLVDEPQLCKDCYPKHCTCEGKVCWCEPDEVLIIGETKVIVHREVH